MARHIGQVSINDFRNDDLMNARHLRRQEQHWRTAVQEAELMTVTRSEEVAASTRATLNIITRSYAMTRRSDQDAQGVIVNTVPSLPYPVLRAGITVYV